jgi:hypothetical protein
VKPWTVVGPVVCLLLIGCDDSKHPLSDPNTSKPDNRLVGVWRWQNGSGDVTYYHIGQAGEKFPQSVMRVVEVKHSSGKVEVPDGFLMFPTILDGKNYLNVVHDGDGGKKPVKLLNEKGWRAELVESYTFLKYQVEGDKLVVWLVDEGPKERAIQSGKVKGVIEANKPACFTGPTADVARFVAQAGESLLNTKEPIRFERVQSGKQR